MLGLKMALLLKQTCLFQRQLFFTRSCLSSFRQLTHGSDSHKNEDSTDSSVPEGPHEIYKGALATQVKGVKTFSFGTSLLGIGMQPMLYEHMSAPDSSIPLMVALYSTVGIFTFVTPFLIHFVTKKYITDITFDPKTNEYTASTYNFIPTKRKLKFKLEDISVPDVPGAFTSLCVKSTPLLCIPSDFLYPEHYIKFMGYDKPVDFQLRTPKENSKDISDKSA